MKMSVTLVQVEMWIAMVSVCTVEPRKLRPPVGPVETGHYSEVVLNGESEVCTKHVHCTHWAYKAGPISEVVLVVRQARFHCVCVYR